MIKLTSLAHLGSKLYLSKTTLSLPDGMVLFPLDGRVEDTTNSFPVLLNVTTPRYDQKRFIGSVAVEDETTNYVTNPTQAQSLVSPTSGFAEPQWNHTHPNGGVVKGTAITYAISFEIQNLGGTPDFSSVIIGGVSGGDAWAVRLYPDGTVSSCTLVSFYKYEIGAKTYRYEYVVTIPSNCYLQTYVKFIAERWHTVNSIVRNVQLEEKDHVTSFVIGSRARGNLKYDITSLGMKNAGCISCWIFNSDAMVNNRATAGGVNNQYLLKVGSYKNNDWYADVISLWIQNTTPRVFKLRCDLASGSGTILNGTRQVSTFGVGTWNHFVFQWDKNGLPSGKKVELYINGQLEIGSTDGSKLPQNTLTYLHVGKWDDSGALMPSTLYEQLAIHPSKGFPPEIIADWYESQAPFFDIRDQFAVI